MKPSENLPRLCTSESHPLGGQKQDPFANPFDEYMVAIKTKFARKPDTLAAAVAEQFGCLHADISRSDLYLGVYTEAGPVSVILLALVPGTLRPADRF